MPASTPKRIRRTADSLRAEAVAAGRDLVRQGAELTLRGVADAIGVTYPNLSHHFGSGAGLHAAVAEAMVRDLLDGLRLVADEVEGSKPRRLVDKVFDLFGAEGLDRVLSWLIRSGEAARLEPVRALLSDYFAGAAARHANGAERIPRIALIVTLAAQAEAEAGALVGDLMGIGAEERRQLFADLIAPLMVPDPY